MENQTNTPSNVTSLNNLDRRFLVYFANYIAPNAVIEAGNVWRLAPQTTIAGMDLDATYPTREAAFLAIVSTAFGQYQRTHAAA